MPCARSTRTAPDCKRAPVEYSTGALLQLLIFVVAVDGAGLGHLGHEDVLHVYALPAAMEEAVLNLHPEDDAQDDPHAQDDEGWDAQEAGEIRG